MGGLGKGLPAFSDRSFMKNICPVVTVITFNWCDQRNREGCVPNKKKQFFGSNLYVALMSNFRRVKYNSNNRK